MAVLLLGEVTVLRADAHARNAGTEAATIAGVARAGIESRCPGSGQQKQVPRTYPAACGRRERSGRTSRQSFVGKTVHWTVF